MSRVLAVLLLTLAMVFAACEAWVNRESARWVRTGINSPEGQKER